jgi:hypothetical protein
MKVLVNREEDKDRSWQSVNWYIPTGERHPDPKYWKLPKNVRESP